MSENYLSVAHEGCSVYEEKKSVFRAFATPTETEQEALAYIAKIKGMFPDARHHVYAYILRDGNKSRYTDDGEPSGTAGMPILDLMKKQALTNVTLVVIRYFGGTLLGTGGLVRAYTTAAKDALTDASVVLWRPFTTLSVSCTYADYTRLEQTLKRVSTESSDFSSEINLVLSMPSESLEAICEEITNRTAGRAKIEIGVEKYGY